MIKSETKIIFLHTIKRFLLPFSIMTAVYTLLLCFSINVSNANSLVYHQIEPYQVGSGPIDLFFPLICSAVFSWNIYFLRKDRFLMYIHVRTNIEKYLKIQIISALLLCFIMVWVSNMIGVIYSTSIASITNSKSVPSLYDYILGTLQMENPLLFGLIWSFHKAIIGMLISFLGQILSMYIDNLFVILTAPFVIVFLENFITSLLAVPKYSFTTVFVLNRLSSTAMNPTNLLIGIMLFCIYVTIFWLILRRTYDHIN